jgi:nucleoid DNA-binding protein
MNAPEAASPQLDEAELQKLREAAAAREAAREQRRKEKDAEKLRKLTARRKSKALLRSRKEAIAASLRAGPNLYSPYHRPIGEQLVEEEFEKPFAKSNPVPVANRQVLARRIARQLGLSIGDAQDFVDCMFDQLNHALGKGEAIVIRNFGTIALTWRNERVARNPTNPEEMLVVPGHNHVKFKPVPALKRSVRKLPKFEHYLNTKNY